MRTKLRADFVLGHEDGRHVIIRDGQVVYDDDVIIHVGRDFPGEVDETIDLGESLVTPGLIDLDALADIDHLILDSWAPADRGKGLEWSEDYFRHRRCDVFTAEERQFIREYALVQLLLHGVTTYMPIAAETHSAWAEDFDELTGMAETSRRLGLRGYLGPAYRSGIHVIRSTGEADVLFDEERGRAGFADALRFLEYARELGDPLVTGVLLPCRIETLTEELMRATADAAAERGTLVRLHCLQEPAELEFLRRRFAATPIELLRRTGLLNDRLLIPHAELIDINTKVDGTDRGDLAALADSGISVIHCPQTSFRYGSALQSFGRYLDAGINICLGSDSFPPDLIRGMDTGIHVAKIIDGAPDAAAVERYFEAATLGGARALKRTDLGRLEPGAQADIVSFALGDIRDGVMEDPVRTLLLNGTARQVTHSVVAGQMLMRDGVVPGLDVAGLRARAQSLFQRMRDAYSERDWQRRPPAELFPPTFPAARTDRTTGQKASRWP